MSGICDRLADVDQVLDHHHRVAALLERLAIEERGQPRQRLASRSGRRCRCTASRRELVRDLVVEGGGEGALLLGCHDREPTRSAQRKPVSDWRRVHRAGRHPGRDRRVVVARGSDVVGRRGVKERGQVLDLAAAAFDLALAAAVDRDPVRVAVLVDRRAAPRSEPNREGFELIALRAIFLTSASECSGASQVTRSACGSSTSARLVVEVGILEVGVGEASRRPRGRAPGRCRRRPGCPCTSPSGRAPAPAPARRSPRSARASQSFSGSSLNSSSG